VSQDDRQRLRPVAGLMNEMEPHPIDLGSKMRERVDAPLSGAPVVCRSPIADELPVVSGINPSVPILAEDAGRQANSSQTGGKIFENGIGDPNPMQRDSSQRFFRRSLTPRCRTSTDHASWPSAWHEWPGCCTT
jgi:hypothetical protein